MENGAKIVDLGFLDGLLFEEIRGEALYAIVELESMLIDVRQNMRLVFEDKAVY